MASSSKMFGFAMIGISLFFLLRKEVSAQELAPSGEIIPSVTPSIAPSIISSIEPSPSIVAPSPTPATTKSAPSQAPSGDSSSPENYFFNPVLQKFVTTPLSITEQALTETGIFSPEAAMAETAGAAGGLILASLGVGQGTFTNPYSGYASMIPMIGTVIGGFLEGILGTGDAPRTLEEAQALSAVEKMRVEVKKLIAELGDLSGTGPYKTILANAQYNTAGWAVPAGWKPGDSGYEQVLSGSGMDVYYVLDYSNPLPFTPYYFVSQIFGYLDSGYPVPITALQKAGMNLFTLLGLDKKVEAILQPLFDAEAEMRSGAAQYM